jgi:acetyltransferase
LINDEELIHLRALLITKDAKKFYEKFGFYNKEDVMQKDKK